MTHWRKRPDPDHHHYGSNGHDVFVNFRLFLAGVMMGVGLVSIFAVWRLVNGY